MRKNKRDIGRNMSEKERCEERVGRGKWKKREKREESEKSRSESQVTATKKQSGGKSQTLEPINSLHMF